MFWVDYSNDNIRRAVGIETGVSSSISNLITSGIPLTGTI